MVHSGRARDGWRGAVRTARLAEGAPMARIARPVSMQHARVSATDPARDAWWALGDAPVRIAETVVPLVDGRAAMLAMCAAILAAKERVWLADWDIHPRL